MLYKSHYIDTNLRVGIFMSSYFFTAIFLFKKHNKIYNYSKFINLIKTISSIKKFLFESNKKELL